MKRIMIVAVILGGCFNLTGCTKQVDDARVAAGKFAAQEEKIKGLESKIEAGIASAESKQAEFEATFDTNGDGKVTKDELTTTIKSKPMTAVGMALNAWRTKDYGMLVLFVMAFFGLHITQAREKLKQYGTKGIVGWVLRLCRVIGKEPPKK